MLSLPKCHRKPEHFLAGPIDVRWKGNLQQPYTPDTSINKCYVGKSNNFKKKTRRGSLISAVSGLKPA